MWRTVFSGYDTPHLLVLPRRSRRTSFEFSLWGFNKEELIWVGVLYAPWPRSGGLVQA